MNAERTPKGKQTKKHLRLSAFIGGQKNKDEGPRIKFFRRLSADQMDKGAKAGASSGRPP